MSSPTLGIVIPVHILPEDRVRLHALCCVLDEVASQIKDEDSVVLAAADDQWWLTHVVAFTKDDVRCRILDCRRDDEVGRGWRLASQRNAGVEALPGRDAYVFLDADCLPAKTWLSVYRDSLEWEPGVVFGRTDHEQANGTVERDPRSSHMRWRPFGPSLRREACLFERGGGGNMMITAATFRDVGPFDEAYDGGFGWEETDYAVRAYQMGAEVLYCETAQVTHLYHPRGRDHFSNIERNRVLFTSRTKLFAGARA